MTRIEYTDKVYSYLHRMKFDTLVEIDSLSGDIIPNEIAKGFFINILKEFIQHDNGRHFGFYCEFNNSYQKIRKIKYFPSPKQKIK